MRITLLLSTIFLFNIIYAQQPNLEWAKSFGGSGYDGAYLVKEDQDGNIYTCGWFSTDTVDFDPGIDTFNIVSQGGQDAFLQKLDANGNFLWAISLGSTGTDQIRAMAIDNDNNVIVSNMFTGTVDFDPGPGIYNLTSNGGLDVFVAKFDPNGSLIWAKSFGSSTSGDKCYAVTTDSLNNVYLAGHFGGTADFDPGPGTYNLSSSGNDDSFISKLDVNGNFIWAQKYGSSGTDQLYGIIFYDDFIYSTGYFNFASGYSRIFHWKLKAQDGTTIWTNQIGPSNSVGLSGGLSLENDDLGNIFITGSFYGTIDFDPGVGTQNHTSNDAADIFVQKIDTLGNMIWTKTMGSVGQDYGQGITHLNGELYLTGVISDTVDIDVSANTNYLASNGNYDIFIAKYDTSFNLIWGENYGNTGSDVGFGIEVNNANEIYVAGWFNDTVDFDNSINVIQTESNGSEDIFVIKLNGCPPSIGSQTVTECDSYTWPADGNTYGSTGTYTATLTNAVGCDSVVTLDLTINPSPNNSVSQTDLVLIADQTGASYQWLDCENGYAIINGETNQSYTPAVTGNYAVEVNMNGCVDTSACFLVDYTGIEELIQTEKELVKIVDFMGRETEFKPNTPLIFIYSDGTRERVMKLEE